MKKIIIIFLLISKPVFSEVKNIGNERLIELIEQNVPVIDVRTEKEWKKTGVIRNSYLISMVDKNGKYSLDRWYNNFLKIDLQKDSVVLICAVGVRSSYLAKLLRRTNENLHIYNLSKGIMNWIENKYPVTSLFNK